MTGRACCALLQPKVLIDRISPFSYSCSCCTLVIKISATVACFHASVAAATAHPVHVGPLLSHVSCDPGEKNNEPLLQARTIEAAQQGREMGQCLETRH